MCDKVNLDYLKKHFPKLQNLTHVLEVGSYNLNGNCKSFIEERGLHYLGLDIQSGPDVDVIADITGDFPQLTTALGRDQFDLVICMNVLEHLYEPVKALTQMRQLLRPGGYLMVVTPLVWDLHEHPHDFYRLNPDFFKKFMKDQAMPAVPETFVLSVRDNRKFYSDTSALPMLIPPGLRKGPQGFLVKVVCKIFLPHWYESWSHIYLNLIMQKESVWMTGRP